jgi:pimeloyl-ACP methyl ester carboxylesterase
MSLRIYCRLQLAGVAAMGALLLTGCATPIGVRQVSEQEVYRQLTASVVSVDEPSAASEQFLQRLALREYYRTNPAWTIATLRSGLGRPDEHARLFVLAELSFLHADRSHDRSHYLAAALYAYAFIFPEDPATAPDAYDPRLRTAVDVYNRAITNGLATDDGNEVDLSPQRLALPFGTLDLESNPAGFTYGGYRLTNFVSLDALEIRGMRNRYRTAGIGAALAAKVEPPDRGIADKWVPARSKVPVTAFVRFADALAAVKLGTAHGTVEVYDADEIPDVRVDQADVPLEFDPSAALAYRLEGAPIWDFELAGFRRADFSLFDTQVTQGLFMLNPYRRGRIPVVFVHGTASSPARWAEMVNELMGDPVIARRYQFWLFIYNTGNPVALSAMRLREGVQAAVHDVDPEGQDPALQQMVVIGHSQGGLLTKMTVVESGTKFWDLVSDVPFDQAKLSPETHDLMRRSLFVEPLPPVKRVIFIATPHRGSFWAGNFVGKIARRFVALPATVTRATVELVTLRPLQAAKTAISPVTAIDNMDPHNDFLRTLASLPIEPGVRVNSIIPVKGDGPVEVGDDGVVEYKSAHIDGVESELVVRSSHSTQAEPQTIEEVRRILYVHAGLTAAAAE